MYTAVAARCDQTRLPSISCSISRVRLRLFFAVEEVGVDAEGDLA